MPFVAGHQYRIIGSHSHCCFKKNTVFFIGKFANIRLRCGNSSVFVKKGCYGSNNIWSNVKLWTRQDRLIFIKDCRCNDGSNTSVKHRSYNLPRRRILMSSQLCRDENVCINNGVHYMETFSMGECKSLISAQISSIDHSRSPFANRSLLPFSKVDQAFRPSIAHWESAPMMKGIERVRTTCLRNTVSAVTAPRTDTP